jgi:immune inhibitor A
MSASKADTLITDLQSIYAHAAQGDDGEKCCVMPSPELQEKINKELAQLKRRKTSLIAPMLEVRAQSRVGFNDGLIVPGDHYPLGTPPALVRSGAADRAPLRGEVRVIVVLVEFSDVHMTATRQHFEELFFSTGVLPKGSVKEYYTEVSNGAVTIAGEVVGPYRLANTMAHYANGASGTGNSLPNARTMAREAALAANPDVNFGLYDNDANGFVDAFIVVHAGRGAEETGNANEIWSHKWVLSGGALNADGTQIYAYLTVPEDAKTGVCCHELGHLLFGWIDFYDTDYSSSGLGNWCLMAGGSWNGNGDRPAHPSAWCKADQGWVSVTNVTSNGQQTIQDVKTSHAVYRLWKDGAASTEYFLLENRQKTQFDQFLPAGGLLVYHVDDTVTSNANESHPKVALLQADGKKDLEAGSNRGDGGDPYPGTANNLILNSASTPSSRSYGNADTCVAVTNISNTGATMTANLAVRCQPAVNKTLKDKLEKESAKEIEKSRKEFFKEHPEKRFKEWPDKRKEKEKEFKELTEKRTEKLSEGWHLGRAPGAGEADPLAVLDDLSQRVQALEAFAGSIEPFIGKALRPDLSQGALGLEADVQRAQEHMAEGTGRAKRQLDTKPRDA